MTVRFAPAKLIFLAFGAIVLAAALGTAQTSRPAVELFSPVPQYPNEALGSGVDPEIEVRVTVDGVGRVTEAQILRITPASELDHFFEAAVLETLRDWRYAPRYENGQPVSTDLQWSMEFIGPREATDRWSGSDLWNRLLGHSPASEVFPRDLPMEQRRPLLEERVRTGLRALGEDRVGVSSPRFIVQTDAGEETANALSNNLEVTFGVLDEMFGKTIPPRFEPLKIQVFAFSEASSMSHLRSACLPTEVTAGGFYENLGLIGLHLQMPTPEHVNELLVHEATHAYHDRHLVKRGVRLPYWLAEGLAEYMANSRIRKGKLVPGRLPGRHVYARVEQGSLRVTLAESTARLGLAAVKLSARRGEALTITEMADAAQEAFLGERLQLYYAMSWLLVHFLRHGEADWESGEFPSFLLYAAEGFPIIEAIETAYGRPISELEEPFRHYITSF